MADELAKQGSSAPQEHEKWLYSTAKSKIWREVKPKALTHARLREIYGSHGETINRPEEGQLDRKDQVTLSHLRCGHHPDLKYWLHKIQRAPDDICRKCGTGPETTEHILRECPRLRYHFVSPTFAADHPREFLTVWERWKTLPDLPDISQPGSN